MSTYIILTNTKETTFWYIIYIIYKLVFYTHSEYFHTKYIGISYNVINSMFYITYKSILTSAVWIIHVYEYNSSNMVCDNIGQANIICLNT